MKRLVLALVALAAVASLLLAIAPVAPVDGEATRPGLDREGQVEGSIGTVAAHRTDGSGVIEHTWHIDYAHTVSLKADAAGHQQVIGIWIATPIGPDRIEVRLDVDRFDGTLAQLDASDLEAPFQLGTTDGRLTGIGFEASVRPAARNLLTSLATEMTYTPGDGAEWQVEEVDLNGRYIARYQTTDRGIRRSRDAFVATHSGRSEGSPEGITASGETRYRLDGHGLTAVTVDEVIRRAFDSLNLTAEAAIRLNAERVSSRRVAPTARRLPLGPIAPVADPGGLAAADRNRIGDADLDQIVAWAAEAAAATGKETPAVRLRASMHARMRAFLRVHPGQTAAFVDALRAGPTPQALAMISALGAAGTPAATAGLVDVLSETGDGDRIKHAQVALGLTASPSPESVEVLLGNLDDPDHGTTAALAAASQARRLGEGSEATDDVIESLIARYADAPDDPTRSLVISALGNSGDRRIVPSLMDGMKRSAGLARVAAYALRHVPGDDVDAALETLLFQHPLELVRIQATRAIAHRDPARWTPTLEAALPALESLPMVRDTAARVLDRWAGRG